MHLRLHRDSRETVRTGSTLCHRPRRLPDFSDPICYQTEPCACVRVCVVRARMGVHAVHVEPCSEENISREWRGSLAAWGFEKNVPGFLGRKSVTTPVSILLHSSFLPPSLPLLSDLCRVKFGWDILPLRSRSAWDVLPLRPHSAKQTTN